MFGDLNESNIVSGSKGIKFGRSPGLDVFPVECLNKCGTVVLERLVRLLNESFDMGAALMDWRGACVVPLSKGKGDECECSKSKGISFLSIVGI